MTYDKNLLSYDNHRSIGIVASIQIDELLKKLLIKHFVADGNVEDIFGNNGPLSSFYSRLEITYRLGLISKEVHSYINVIRKIRNICAHSFGVEKDFDFGNEEILYLIREKIFPDPNIDKTDKNKDTRYLEIRKKIDPQTSYLLFIHLSVCLINYLNIRIRKIKKRKTTKVKLNIPHMEKVFNKKELAKIFARVLQVPEKNIKEGLKPLIKR
jgi:DNA-binding MltR family transcriptional regulator